MNRGSIIGSHLKPHGSAAAPESPLLGFCQQPSRQPAAPKTRSDCNRVEAGLCGISPIIHQRGAGEDRIDIGNDQLRICRAYEMAKAAARELVIRSEKFLLHGEQGIEVRQPPAAQFCGERPARSRHDARPCSIRSMMVSSRSSRSASPGGLSHRNRLMRGNRIARPDLCRVERCKPSNATSNTRPRPGS